MIVEALLAVGFGFATLALLYVSIVIFMFGSLRERKSRVVWKALAACNIALYALALFAALKGWMGSELARTWSDLARGAFYSALAATILITSFVIAGWVERWLERMSPENAKRFQKAFLIAFIASTIAALILRG